MPFRPLEPASHCTACTGPCGARQEQVPTLRLRDPSKDTPDSAAASGHGSSGSCPNLFHLWGIQGGFVFVRRAF